MLKHWELWAPGSAWNTGLAKGLLTDLRDIVNYVSHFFTLHNPKLLPWPQFRQSLLSDWVLFWQGQLGCPFRVPSVSDCRLPRPGPCLICHTCKSGSKASLPVLRVKVLWAGVTERNRYSWTALACSIGQDIPVGSAVCSNLWKPVALCQSGLSAAASKGTVMDCLLVPCQ